MCMSKSIIPPWSLWAFVTSISSIVGFSLGYLISDYLIPDRYFANHHLQTPFLFIIITIVGLIIGFGQWTLLRATLEKSWKWIPATTIGLPLGLFIGFIVVNILLIFIDLQNTWIVYFITAGIAGAFIGTLQGFALYAKLQGLVTWILVSALGWGFGFAIISFASETFLSHVNSWYISYPFDGITIGIMVGLFTGAFIESTLVDQRVNKPISTKNAS